MEWHIAQYHTLHLTVPFSRKLRYCNQDISMNLQMANKAAEQKQYTVYAGNNRMKNPTKNF